MRIGGLVAHRLGQDRIDQPDDGRVILGVHEVAAIGNLLREPAEKHVGTPVRPRQLLVNLPRTPSHVRRLVPISAHRVTEALPRLLGMPDPHRLSLARRRFDGDLPLLPEPVHEILYVGNAGFLPGRSPVLRQLPPPRRPAPRG